MSPQVPESPPPARWQLPGAVGRYAMLGGLIAACALVVILAIQRRDVTHSYMQAAGYVRNPYVGLYLPRLELRAVRGDRLTFSGLRPGHTQVVIFFSSTCPYCRHSLQDWAALADRIRGDTRTAFLAVQFDSSADSTSLGFFPTGDDIPVATVLDARTQALMHVTSVPQTIVLDSVGRVTFAHSGVMTRAALDSILDLWRSPAAAEHGFPGAPLKKGG